MTTPDADPAGSETVLAPPPAAPADAQDTIDLRSTVPHRTIDLRETRETIVIPAQQVAAPATEQPTGQPTEQLPPPPPVEVLRFGPGVPAVIATAPVLAAEASVPPRSVRRNRVLNLALTLALAAVVIWLLWPAGSLHVRAVSVRATPAVVACEKTADVVATVRTNGNAGQLKYRWTRNDGVGSGTLLQSLARGQHSVDLHLRWAFHGPGTYDAQATVQLISPAASSATVNFRYVC